MNGDISYKTHILVGVRPNGMKVLADWAYVPKQAEVQKEIDAAQNGYVTFMLCTPTSIMPARGNGDGRTGGAQTWSGEACEETPLAIGLHLHARTPLRKHSRCTISACNFSAGDVRFILFAIWDRQTAPSLSLSTSLSTNSNDASLTRVPSTPSTVPMCLPSCRDASLLRLHELVADRVTHERADEERLSLRMMVRAMRLHGLDADVEKLADLLVRMSFGDELDHSRSRLVSTDCGRLGFVRNDLSNASETLDVKKGLWDASASMAAIKSRFASVLRR